MFLRLALAAMLAAAALPAAAQDRPPAHPSRDVTVTYRFEGAPQGAAEMRLSWLQAEQKMRIDTPGGQGWIVTDTRSGTSFMVQDQARMIMQLPRNPSMPDLSRPPPGTSFTRAGTETLLGHRCTVWRVTGPLGEGEACVTDDGVMLRTRGSASGTPGGGQGGGQGGAMVATQVSFGPQDPARFRAPQDYQTMTVPGMPGGGPAGPRPGAPR
jgi:hypothetical protein